MGAALTQITTTLFGGADAPGVIPQVFEWITSAEVLPYVAISIGISLTLFAIKGIKSVMWGA